MAAKILSTEEFRKKYGPMPTTISTISPAEFGRRLEEHATKLEEAEAKKKAEAKAQATSSHTEK